MGDIGEDVHLETMQIPVHEDVNLDSTQLLNLSSQLVTTMAHDREAMRPVAGQGCTLKIFFLVIASIASMGTVIASI
jgi:hypothetical protein